MKRIVATHNLTTAEEFLKHNKLLLIVSAFLFTGMIVGVLTVEHIDSAEMFVLFKNFVLSRQGQSFFVSLFHSFLSLLPLFLLTYVAGICVVGAPLSIFIPFLNGLGMGLISGYLYSVYSLKGISFFALILLPGNFIYCICLILAGREAFRFSTRLFKVITPRFKPYGLYNEYRLYTMRFLVLLAAVVLSAVISAVMASAFFKYFSF